MPLAATYTTNTEMNSLSEKSTTGFSREMDRKVFLRTAGSVALFGALGISLSSCGVTSSKSDEDPIAGLEIDGDTVRLNLASEELQFLREEGAWRHLTEARMLVVNVDGQLIRAFFDVCPHLGCNDSWRYVNLRLECTCHNSVFSNDGVRVSGPATRNLTEFEVTREGDSVVILR